MTTKEKIIAEINKVPEKDLDNLYRLIQRFKVAEENGDKSNWNSMSELRRISINASPEFSTTIGLYDTDNKDVG
jgi:hypothetical protein